MYRLVCRDTYEAQIFKIASLKSGLDEAILGQVSSSGDTVADAKMIADLLKCATWPPVLVSAASPAARDGQRSSVQRGAAGAPQPA